MIEEEKKKKKEREYLKIDETSSSAIVERDSRKVDAACLWYLSEHPKFDNLINMAIQNGRTRNLYEQTLLIRAGIHQDLLNQTGFIKQNEDDLYEEIFIKSSHQINSNQLNQCQFYSSTGRFGTNLYLIFDKSSDIPVNFGYLGRVHNEISDVRICYLPNFPASINRFGNELLTNLETILPSYGWSEVGEPKPIFKGLLPRKGELTLGLDAEFELYKDGLMRDANKIGRFASLSDEIGCDAYGHQVEIRPKPSLTHEELINNIEFLMNEIFRSGYQVGTDGDTWPLGAHIHFGTRYDAGFAKILDWWIAKKVWHLNGGARGHFKELSAYRHADTHYGWEYRSLPSTILRDKQLAILILKIVEGLYKDYYNGIVIPVKPLKVDYMKYITEEEWRIFKRELKDKNRELKCESWGISPPHQIRFSSIYKLNSIYSPINVDFFFYGIRKRNPPEIWISPLNSRIGDIMLKCLLNFDLSEKFKITNKYVSICPPNSYCIGLSRDLRDTMFINNLIDLIINSREFPCEFDTIVTVDGDQDLEIESGSGRDYRRYTIRRIGDSEHRDSSSDYRIRSTSA